MVGVVEVSDHEVDIVDVEVVQGTKLHSVGVLTPIPLRLSLGQLGSMGPVHPKDDVRPSQHGWSPAQGVNADLAIKQDPSRLE